MNKEKKLILVKLLFVYLQRTFKTNKMKDIPREVKLAVQILEEVKDLRDELFKEEATELLNNLYRGNLEYIYEHEAVRSHFDDCQSVETNSIIWENDLYCYEVVALKDNNNFWINFKNKKTGKEDYWDNDKFIYGLICENDDDIFLLKKDIPEPREVNSFISFLKDAQKKGYIK